jgi:hypothetical protein
MLSEIEIVFYKRSDTFIHWFIQYGTKSPYAHCEIIIDGIGYSSVGRDGGVRAKVFEPDHKKWDSVIFLADKEKILNWFKIHDRKPYDYLGLFYFLIPVRFHTGNRWFCSESCGAAIGMKRPDLLCPSLLFIKLFRTPHFKARFNHYFPKENNHVQTQS